MDYRDKYLKYKEKYLELKKLQGGGKFSKELNILMKMKNIPAGPLKKIFEKQDFEIDEHKEEMEKIKDYEIQVKLKTMPFINWVGENIDNEKIKNYFGAPKNCSLEELMTIDIPQINCKNLTRVTGSCGSPSFLESNNDINESQKNEWINIINIITEKFKNEIEPKYLDLIIGATSISSDFDTKNSFTLIISPIPRFDDYATFIPKLNELSIIKNQILTFNGYFPLSHNFPNGLNILNRLIQLNKSGINVRVINRMCGSCHRSLYYLVKNGIEYTVNPEQGVGVQDTEEIKRCFKI